MIEDNRREIIDAYVTRDEVMELNPVYTIQKALQKLKYLNVDMNSEVQVYIKEHITAILREDATVRELMDEIKETDKFYQFFNHLKHRVERSILLSKFLDTNNIEEFYSSLTFEELVYLGY